MVETLKLPHEKLPIFRKYTVEQLADLFAGIYSAATIEDLSHRRLDRMTDKFRATASRILGQPEAELFGCEDE